MRADGSMNNKRHDDILLARFVQNLSARRSRQGFYSPNDNPFHCGLKEIPAALDPLSLCSYNIPCLSLHTSSTSSLNSSVRLSAADHHHLANIQVARCSSSSTTTTGLSSPLSSPREKLGQEQHYMRLLAREIRCNTVSAASSIMLMNFVETFGKLLQMELRRKLYNLIAKLEKHCSNSLENRQRKEAIYKAFEDQALTDEPPVVPVSFSTRFYTNMDTTNQNYDEIVQDSSFPSTSIMFEAKIKLQLNPSCSLVTCRLIAPGEVKLNYQSERKSNIMDSISVVLDMDVLYRSIMKECKYISKLTLNGIVGHNAFGNNWMIKSNVDTTKVESPKKNVVNGTARQSTSILPSDSVTHSTVATSEDHSFEEFRKRNAIANRSDTSKLPRLSISDDEKIITSLSRQQKKQQQQQRQRQKLGATATETNQMLNLSTKQTSKKKMLKWLTKIPSAKRDVKQQKLTIMN